MLNLRTTLLSVTVITMLSACGSNDSKSVSDNPVEAQQVSKKMMGDANRNNECTYEFLKESDLLSQGTVELSDMLNRKEDPKAILAKAEVVLQQCDAMVASYKVDATATPVLPPVTEPTVELQSMENPEPQATVAPEAAQGQFCSISNEDGSESLDDRRYLADIEAACQQTVQLIDRLKVAPSPSAPAGEVQPEQSTVAPTARR